MDYESSSRSSEYLLLFLGMVLIALIVVAFILMAVFSQKDRIGSIIPPFWAEQNERRGTEAINADNFFEIEPENAVALQRHSTQLQITL
ncbi:MAG: hypothetical protein JW772_05025 [Candidatus Diapherotrites archaeon]|nr:hypothetical protein [Candidatus Diapherotrites archaeon]